MKKLLILLVFLMVSCTSIKEVQVPVEVTKTEYRDKFIHDSIYIKDSVGSQIKNDTVFLTKYKYIHQTKLERDTIIQRDTIPKTIRVETVKEVNKLRNWQIILMVLGGGFIVLLLNKIRKFKF